MWHPEYHAMIKREQVRDYLIEADQDRLVAASDTRRLNLADRAARRFSRVLIWLAASLLRFKPGGLITRDLDQHGNAAAGGVDAATHHAHAKPTCVINHGHTGHTCRHQA